MNGGDSQFQQPITGTFTASSQSFEITSPNQTISIIQITGTWVGSIVVEGSNNNSTFSNVPIILNTSTGLPLSTLITSGIYVALTNGYQYVRVRSSAWTSGTATIAVYGSDAASLLSSISLIRGGTDGNIVGNVGDRLKVDAVLSSGSVTITALIAACNIFRQNEITVSVKVETDLPSSTYTVPAGKTFNLVNFGGSYDAQQPMYLRLKKQTGGTGAFVTIFRANLSVNGQDASNYNITVPTGLAIGVAGDVFKLTYEPSVGRGVLWADYMGVEY